MKPGAGFELEKSVGYLVNRVAKEMKEELERKMARFGVTAHQWAVLIQLYNHDEMTSGELGQLIGIDAAAMTRMLDRLEDKRLVARRHHPADRRAWLVALTSQGRALAPKLPPVAREVLGTFLAGFDGKEVAQLVGLLERVLRNTPQPPDEEDEP